MHCAQEDPPRPAASTGEPQYRTSNRVSTRDALNKETTPGRRHRRTRLSPGDNNPSEKEMPTHHSDASKEENDALRHRRRQHRKGWAGFSSVLSHTFLASHRIGQHCLCWATPLPPQHLSIEIVTSRCTDTPHGREQPICHLPLRATLRHQQGRRHLRQTSKQRPSCDPELVAKEPDLDTAAGTTIMRAPVFGTANPIPSISLGRPQEC